MFNIVYCGGKCTLKIAGDPIRHFIRRQPRIAPYHTHNRNVNVRKNVGWRTHDGERTEDKDQ